MRAFRPGEVTELYGIPAEAIAEICGVHITTARRWKRGEEPPRTALEVLKLRWTGELAIVDTQWSGWKIVGGELVTPEGDVFTQADIRAAPFWRRLAKTYQNEQKLPRQGDWVDGMWKPNEIEIDDVRTG